MKLAVKSLPLRPLILGLLIALGACGGNESKDQIPATNGPITVFAASSLTDAFKQIGLEFERTHVGSTVTLNFASSSVLSTQIKEGAPADVFAAADPDTMGALVTGGQAEAPRVFATNALVIVVPRDGTTVKAFSDLAKPGVKLVLAGKDVPAGKYARQVLAKASVDPDLGADFASRVLANVKSEESSVRAVLAKVQLGDADAGVVYRTDLQAAKGEVVGITFPSDFNIVATYPIAVIKDRKQNATARGFVDFVNSKSGQEILARYGFGGAP